MNSQRGVNVFSRETTRVHFRWATPAIITDWVVAFTLYGVSRIIEKNVKPYQRDPAQYLNDPWIAFPHVKHERVSYEACVLLTICLPAFLIVIAGAVRRSLEEVNAGLLTYFAGHMMMRVPVDIIKLGVGRLRPDFLARCQYDILDGVCTGDHKLVTEGRKSFPSGHSSTSFLGMTLFVLFLAGKTRAFCFSNALPSKSFGARSSGLFASRLLRLTLTMVPFCLSGYIAISRLEDHVHHPTDVIAGSSIGVIVGVVAYLIWWPSPFVFRENPEAIESMDKPREWGVQESLNVLSLSEDGEEERLLHEETV